MQSKFDVQRWHQQVKLTCSVALVYQQHHIYKRISHTQQRQHPLAQEVA